MDLTLKNMEYDVTKVYQGAPLVKLGELLEIVDELNTTGLRLPFFGVNKDKQFMPTIANTDGLNPTKYKIIRKNRFVFSGMQTGRDMCIRFALYTNDQPVLLSPAYTLLKVVDEDKILPEYLHLYFLSTERDRLGAFYSDASVRANLELYRFFQIAIPLPAIEVQRKYVAAYHSLQQLAEQNEALAQPLQDTCTSFIANAKSKYNLEPIGQFISIDEEKNSTGVNLPFMGVDISKSIVPTSANTDGLDPKKYLILRKNKLVFSGMQTGRDVAIRLAIHRHENPVLISSAYTTFVINDETKLVPEFLYLNFLSSEMDRIGWFYSDSSVRSNLDWPRFCEIKIPLPPIEVQRSIVALYNCAEEARAIAREAREQLKTLAPAMVQRAANNPMA